MKKIKIKELLIIIATLATTEVSAGALAKADQYYISLSLIENLITDYLLTNLHGLLCFSALSSGLGCLAFLTVSIVTSSDLSGLSGLSGFSDSSYFSSCQVSQPCHALSSFSDYSCLSGLCD